MSVFSLFQFRNRPNIRFFGLATVLAALLLSGCQSVPSGDVSNSFKLMKGGDKVVVEEKVTPGIKYFSTTKTLSSEEFKEQTRGIAGQVATAVGKSKVLKVDGPLMLIYKDRISMPESAITAQIGFPIKGYTKDTAPYALESKTPFKCLSLLHSSNRETTRENWQFLYDFAKEKGYQLSGEYRTVVTVGVTGVKAELQLGIL